MELNKRSEYPHVDNSWTLFLDRDGVINKKLNGYVTNINEFEFLPGAIEAISEATDLFGRIIVVTNQQCIGKEIISHSDLQSIHNFMIKHIEDSRGYIDQIFYCPNLVSEESPNRKPNPGMGLAAKEMFPDINFKKSIMIGDSPSDITFGNTLSMVTVRIADQKDVLANFTNSSLSDFILYLNK